MSSNKRIAQVNSDGTISPGQKHRSSENFHFTVPEGAIDLQWLVTNSPNVSTVTFDVKQDIKWGTDLVVAEGRTSGSYSSLSQFEAGQKYYIANPSKNPGNPPPAFTVELYAVFPG